MTSSLVEGDHASEKHQVTRYHRAPTTRPRDVPAPPHDMNTNKVAGGVERPFGAEFTDVNIFIFECKICMLLFSRDVE